MYQDNVFKTGKGMLVNAYKVNAFINDLQAFTEGELTNMN